SKIFGRWQAPLTLEDTLTYLLGPILALALRRLGRVCLHASAVAYDNRAILFGGPAESGKSTTAALLFRQGARALSDDVSAISDLGTKFAVEPGHRWF